MILYSNTMHTMIHSSCQERNRGKVRGPHYYLYSIQFEITKILAAVLSPKLVRSSHWATAVQRKGRLLLSYVLYLSLNLPAVEHYYCKKDQHSSQSIYIL